MQLISPTEPRSTLDFCAAAARLLRSKNLWVAAAFELCAGMFVVELAHADTTEPAPPALLFDEKMHTTAPGTLDSSKLVRQDAACMIPWEALTERDIDPKATACTKDTLRKMLTQAAAMEPSAQIMTIRALGIFTMLSFDLDPDGNFRDIGDWLASACSSAEPADSILVSA